MIQTLQKQYTLSGSSDLEARIHSIVLDVAGVVRKYVPANDYHALVLIGGYGRGEGGVRVEDGTELPNNNLDFLLITRSIKSQAAQSYQQQVDQELDLLQRRHKVGIDFSVISGDTLRRSPSRIMWYDMRGGHRTVLGDSGYVPALDHFRIDRIPSWDVHNLLVNRGTLLVINECLPSADDSDDLQRLRTRHSVKAIIGYGDALLFARGQYHWSYAEKQRRMRTLPNIAPAFRQLYDRAADFRFRPTAEAVPGFLRFPAAVLEQCENAHRAFESDRLKVAIPDWNEYLEIALRAGVWEDANSSLGLARSLRNGLRNRTAPVGSGRVARFGQRILSGQRLLGLLFPAVMYESCSTAFRGKAAAVLRADGTTTSDLRKAYLRGWGQMVDRNFFRFLSRYHISLDSMEASV
jgi:hypothetical protein